MSSPALYTKSDAKTTNVLYLKRDERYLYEKPYKLRYDPGEGISRTNCTNESKTIEVRSLRGNENQLTLDEHGFTWLELHSALSSDEFYKAEQVEKVYYAELRHLLKELLLPDRIEFLEHQVCRECNDKSSANVSHMKRHASVINSSQSLMERNSRIFNQQPLYTLVCTCHGTLIILTD
jgi:hypothetical protein